MTTIFSKKIKKRYRKIGNRFDFGNGIRSLNKLAEKMSEKLSEETDEDKNIDVGLLSRVFISGERRGSDELLTLFCKTTNAPQSVYDELRQALYEDLAAQKGIDLDFLFNEWKKRR